MLRYELAVDDGEEEWKTLQKCSETWRLNLVRWLCTFLFR